METLPEEIIEIILKYPTLTIKDVLNFSCTCTRIKEIVIPNQTLWKSKYFQRWPKTDFEIHTFDWYSECIKRKKFEKEAVELLSDMSSKFYNYNMKNINSFHLNYVNDFIKSYEYGYYYLKEHLIKIISLPISVSLTDKYYGSILLKFIQKNHYTQIWKDLISRDDKEHTLEKGAIFVNLWCEGIEKGMVRSIEADLDNVAAIVKNYISKEYKFHPLCEVPKETLLKWKNENLPGNMFEPRFSCMILASINHILFDCLKYSVMNKINKSDRKYLFIDQAMVDRRLTPIMFAFFYESIARRLGIRVEILEFLGHTLIRWKENYNIEDGPYHYINMNNNNLFINRQSCPRQFNNNLVVSPCTMAQIATKIASEIYFLKKAEVCFQSMKDIIDLLLVINPYSFEWIEQLARCHILNEMGVEEFLMMLTAIKSKIPKVEWIRFRPLFESIEMFQKRLEFLKNMENGETMDCHLRTPDVEFAVGMIVRHKLFNGVGVIYGWDRICKDNSRSENLVAQPFYKLLMSDDNINYEPQQHLQILHSPPFISHSFIGRYFDEYCTTFYKPNKVLQSKYPEDLEALQKILKKDREV